MGERWFRVLDGFVDSGIINELTGAQLRLMLHLLRVRDHQTGRAVVTPAQLQASCRLSERAVQLAIKRLVSHPAGLLARSGTDIFEIFPRRLWAGRVTPVDRTVAQAVAPTRKDLRQGALDCAPVHCAFVLPGHELEKETTTTEEQEDRERHRVAVALLVNEGFERHDAEAIGRQAGLSRVRGVIASADALQSHREGSKIRNRRGYIVKGCKERFALHQPLEKRLGHLLHQKVRGLVPVETLTELARRNLKGATLIVREGLVDVHEVQSLSGSELIELIVRRVKRVPTGSLARE